MYVRKLGWVIVLMLVGAVLAGLGRQADAQDSKTKKAIDRLNRQLGKLRPISTYKKDEDDYFIVGTAELNTVTGHADVRFEVKQGQRATAEFLYRYVADTSADMVRKWHVFYRAKDDQKAQEAVMHTRNQYDQTVAYREHLKRLYKAATMRRC
jgi:hypothetical protein